MNKMSSVKVCFGVLVLMSLMITSASADAQISMQIAPQKYNYVVGETIVITGGIYNFGPDAAKQIDVSMGGTNTVEFKNISINGVSTNCPQKIVCASTYFGEVKPGESIPITIEATAVKTGKNIDILADVTSWDANGMMYIYYTGAYIASITNQFPAPEFPSIALPIVAVLGLVLILRRMK